MTSQYGILEIAMDDPQDLLTMEQEWEAIDDVKGVPLDPDKARAAREVEMSFVKKRGIWRYYRRKPGDPTPVGVKWVDTNKGDEIRENYRSRRVAMDFRRSKAGSRFVATPPL